MCHSGYIFSALWVLVYLRSAQGPSMSHKSMWLPLCGSGVQDVTLCTS